MGGDSALWAEPPLLWAESLLPAPSFPSQMASEEDEHTTSCFCLSKVCIFNKTCMGPASSNCSFSMNVNKIQGLRSLRRRPGGSL